METGVKWVRTLYFFLLVGLAIITGSLFVVVSTLNKQYDVNSAELRQSLIWHSAQLVVEYQRLLHSVDTLIVHDGGASYGQEVASRFDILWSRASRLNEGPVGEKLTVASGFETLTTQMSDMVTRAERLIPAVRTGDVERAHELRDILTELSPALERYRSAVYKLQLDAAAHQRDVLNGTVDTVTFLIIGLLVAGASVAGLLLRDQNRLMRLHEMLERRVIARTGELARANAELRAANERLSQFNNLASHDLKEPVRKITVFSDLLLQGVADKDEETIGYAANVMRASAGRAKALISNLLDYSAASDRTMDRERVSLGLAVERACENLSELIRERGAQVTVTGGEAVVEGDPLFIEQLFQNLIGNAVKFCRPEETPRVTVEIVQDEAGHARQVHVRDNGIGFDMRHQTHVFEPFRRLHARDQFAGTGMGLAICAAIAHRHGWRIGVSSQPGEGSDFFIDLAGSTLPEPEVAETSSTVTATATATG